MTDDIDPVELFMKSLEKSGFFEQIQALERTMRSVATDLEGIGVVNAQRMDETESLATHVLALEAVLSAILEKVDVDLDEVSDIVSQRTQALGKDSKSGATVQALAADILGRAKPLN